MVQMTQIRRMSHEPKTILQPLVTHLPTPTLPTNERIWWHKETRPQTSH